MMPQFAGYIVIGCLPWAEPRRRARSVVGGGPAGDRVTAATDEAGRLIRDIGTMAFGLAAGPGNHTSDR